MKIKKARKLSGLDLLKAFQGMPQNFVFSFFAERFTKLHLNLPSFVFKAQIDPRTMMWKDMLPVLTENLKPEQQKAENKPRLRPIPTSLGCIITIEGAEGVPLPAEGPNIDR